jgi:hypothetical protein
MLSLKFSVRLKLRLKGKCPKHPRFTPEVGQGAIRGGCRECLALYQVVAARDQAAAAATPRTFWGREPSACLPYRGRRSDRGQEPLGTPPPGTAYARGLHLES